MLACATLGFLKEESLVGPFWNRCVMKQVVKARTLYYFWSSQRMEIRHIKTQGMKSIEIL